MPWLAEIKAEETQTPTHTHSTKRTRPDHSRAEGYKEPKERLPSLQSLCESLASDHRLQGQEAWAQGSMGALCSLF